jgi:hypothetical protein
MRGLPLGKQFKPGFHMVVTVVKIESRSQHFTVELIITVIRTEWL